MTAVLAAAAAPTASAVGSASGTGGGMTQGSRITGTGTVRFNPLEGGFFQIEVDERTTYTPTNGLPARYRRDGLRVRFVGRLRPDAMTIHMSGRSLELQDIQQE